MKTSADRTRTFEHLFSIPGEILRQELSSPGELFGRLSNQQILPRGTTPSKQNAWLLHRVLLLTFAMQESKKFAIADYLFMAADVASEVATEAMVAAMEKGRPRQLLLTLDRIKVREGRPYPLGWRRGAGPADYETAACELRTLLFKTYGTIKSELFSRYRLASVLEVFEKDTSRFNEIAHQGRTGPRSHSLAVDHSRVDVRGIIKLPASRVNTLMEHLDREPEPPREAQVESEPITLSN